MIRLLVFALVSVTVVQSLTAQSQTFYGGSNITGQLRLVRTVDALAVAQRPAAFRVGAISPIWRPAFGPQAEFRYIPKLPRPSLPKVRTLSVPGPSQLSLAAPASTYTLQVQPGIAPMGFRAITHYDQRMANFGNQYSVEPPSESIAVAGGYVLEGVNNAIQVYNTAGTALLPKVISTNELFGVPPAIDRMTGINGPFPTDMKVFYDQTINRWIVLQRAQDYSVDGFPINSSRLYMAVSQTANPTRFYNIYEMNTTDPANPSCPCFFDFPQIGADQYGFHIAGNEYNTFNETFVNAVVLSISKASLAGDSASPTAFRFLLPFSSGYEFALQPATTPPGASYNTSNGGLEYFISTNAAFAFESRVAVWALYNTGSLNTVNPNLVLTSKTFASPQYLYPDVATQRPGPIPYGASLGQGLAFIDAADNRVLSATYAGGRLFATYATRVADDTGRSLAGGAYLVLSPTFRAGSLSAPIYRAGNLAVQQNHLLRPAIAVNAAGKGAIAFTLVGPDYFPTAAYVPFDVATPPSVLRIAASGEAPQDGFTGYQGNAARWGDYSGAVVAPDGSIWLATQYIPNAPRTEAANWGTHVVRHIP